MGRTKQISACSERAGRSSGALRNALVRSPGKQRPVSFPARSDAPLRPSRPVRSEPGGAASAERRSGGMISLVGALDPRIRVSWVCLVLEALRACKIRYGTTSHAHG